MRFRVLLLTVLCWLAAAAAAAQTSDQDLPSAPSATVQQNAPPKQPPPPATKPAKPHPDNELRPGDNTTQDPAPAADSAQPAAQSAPGAEETSAPATPAASGATTAAPAPTPAAMPPPSVAPQLQNLEKSDANEPVTTIRVPVNEVRVIFTVSDKHGRFIKDLKKTDFRVIDDRKPAEQIRSFHSETDLPLQVGLLIDASNSVRDRFKFEQEAAIEFLNAIIRPRYDKAFVVGFDATPDVTQDFTDNTELLSKGVKALRAGGGTAMYDAIYYACRDKLLKQEQTGPVRRAIILLSDGDDNLSHVTREEAIEMAERAEVIIYTISTNVSGKVLERIAEATGGRAFFPFQIRDVTDAFASIQDELRSQYAMSYKPADFVFDGRYRTIEILAQNKGLHVRTRKGYYAPRP